MTETKDRQHCNLNNKLLSPYRLCPIKLVVLFPVLRDTLFIHTEIHPFRMPPLPRLQLQHISNDLPREVSEI